MQTICTPDEKVSKLWKPRVTKNAVYRRMYYTLENTCEDGILLHNCISGQLVLLSPEESAVLKELPMPFQPEMVSLIESGFLVPVDFDEHAIVGQLRLILRAMQDMRYITHYTIEPTTYCNARCYYCYECDFKHIHMTKETADQLVEFMVSHSYGKRLGLHWFGGEPTVNASMIDYITTCLRKRDVTYVSEMTSNGYLFDENMVKRAKDNWHLETIQITLDGTEEIYNQTKAYIGNQSQSPFRKVLHNIRLLAEAEIQVNIRLNLSDSNGADLEVLVHMLSREFSGNRYVSAYAHALFENAGTNPEVYSDEKRMVLSRQVNRLNDIIRSNARYGHVKNLPRLRISHCMADNDTCLIVLPNGKFVKCEHCNGEGNAVGSLKTGITDSKMVSEFHRYIEFPECRTCAQYPTCLRVNGCPLAERCDSVLKEHDSVVYRAKLPQMYNQYKGGKSNERI